MKTHLIRRARVLAAMVVGLLLGAAAPVGAQPSSPYGVCAHVPSNVELDRAQQVGFPWIRLDFNWNDMEPAKGRFNWAATDRIVREAQRRGQTIFATLAYSPNWANGGRGRAVPPSNFRDWYDFVFATVQRYRGTVKHWGLWNEPNLDGFFDGTKDQYIDGILKFGYQAVKAADPGGLTLGPELAHHTSGRKNWVKWLEAVLNRGGQWIDIISHHIYKDRPSEVFRHLDGRWRWPWEAPALKKVLARNGASNKQVWITETGFRSDTRGLSKQASYLVDLMKGIDQRGWLQKIFLYELTDDPNINAKWGVVDPALNPKPSFASCRDYIRSKTGVAPPAPTPGPTPTPAPGPATPAPAPSSGSWVFEAEQHLAHQRGRRDADGWSCNTAADSAGFMCYGPYTSAVPAGQNVATFRLLVDNTTADNLKVVTVDVFDATSGRVLAQREVRRRELSTPFGYQEFAVAFTSQAGHLLEFRTFWHDSSYVRQDRVVVTHR